MMGQQNYSLFQPISDTFPILAGDLKQSLYGNPKGYHEKSSDF